MKKPELKKLAELTSEKNIINENVKEFVLNRLSGKEMRDYFFYLSEEILRKKVVVSLPSVPDDALKQAVSSLFKGRIMEYRKDETLGAGIRIEDYDTLIEMNLKNIVRKTVNTLKESL